MRVAIKHFESSRVAHWSWHNNLLNWSNQKGKIILRSGLWERQLCSHHKFFFLNCVRLLATNKFLRLFCKTTVEGYHFLIFLIKKKKKPLKICGPSYQTEPTHANYLLNFFLSPLHIYTYTTHALRACYFQYKDK